ncbi:hypothetical protein LR48_Vigan181s003600 [Vigna angularis]|uniref:Uncharacterized protein n=1 Tax=Phaseolus angularis TaxID=3914 RepID=A0A0L9T5A1_PHAAN|nr:hypothetical protein LR48_Vigan181s003600 [Vigna angularis]
MAFQPKIEFGSLPSFIPTANEKEYGDMRTRIESEAFGFGVIKIMSVCLYLLSSDSDHDHLVNLECLVLSISDVNFVFWSVYPYTQSIVHTQIEKNNCQLNYASVKTTYSSIVIQIWMSRVLGIYLASVGECQLDYASVKMSCVLGIYLASVGECQLNYASVKMSRVSCGLMSMP